VDDAAIVSRLVRRDTVFFLDYDEAQLRKPTRSLHCRGEPDDSRADDQQIGFAIGHTSMLGPSSKVYHDTRHTIAQHGSPQIVCWVAIRYTPFALRQNCRAQGEEHSISSTSSLS
jgi:hypothetical protein